MHDWTECAAQVPPAIPTLAMCWLASIRHGAAFIIDWHNFAYTLMQLSMSRRHPLVHRALGSIMLLAEEQRCMPRLGAYVSHADMQ